MSDFVNTVDLVGDDNLTASIIDRGITEIVDDMVTKVGQYAFYNCQALTSVNLPSAITVDTMAFGSCSALSNVNLPLVTKLNTGAFNFCTALVNVIFQSATRVENTVFNQCTALNVVDLPSATYIDGSAFQLCKALRTIVLRNETSVCKLSSNPYFSSYPYIYVPSALLESYKAATNWSTYASRIRSLEDYTVDGTTTGELDPTKI